MGERMGGKEEMAMEGTMITGMVVAPDKVTVEEEVETIIHKTEVGVEDVVEEITEEVEEATITQVVAAMGEGKVVVVVITVKITEVGEEIVLTFPEVTVQITTVTKQMVVTVGPWRTEVITTGAVEIITVTIGVGEVAVLITVADRNITVPDKEAILMIIATVEGEEVTGAVAEVEGQQNTQPRNWR